MTLLRLALIPLVFTLTACVPKDSGETDSDATAGTGGSTGSTTSESTGEPTTGVGVVCEEFLNKPITGPEVVVTIENQRDVAVFVLPGPACTSDPLLDLGGPGGDSLVFRATICDYTCNEQFEGTCLCAADCALAPTIRIEAGGKFTYTWDGGVYTGVQPPEACFTQDCGPGCNRNEPAPAGDYVFATQVGADVMGCVDTPDLCTCTPNADGWCELPSVDATQITGATPIEQAFAYPTETAVALVVE